MSEAGSSITVVFDSIHYVLSAERTFHQRGLWCDLVPTPMDLGASCGMVLEFHASDRERAWEILRDPRLRVKGVYQNQKEGFVQLEP